MSESLIVLLTNLSLSVRLHPITTRLLCTMYFFKSKSISQTWPAVFVLCNFNISAPYYTTPPTVFIKHGQLYLFKAISIFLDSINSLLRHLLPLHCKSRTKFTHINCFQFDDTLYTLDREIKKDLH